MEGEIAKMAEPLRIFQEIDANQVGRLTREELMGGLADHGMTDAEIEQLFLRLDTDGDGTISQEEWVEGYVQLELEVMVGGASAGFSASELEAVHERFRWDGTALLGDFKEGEDGEYEGKRRTSLADVAEALCDARYQGATSVSLDFECCKQLADVSSLGASLESLKALEELRLDFRGDLWRGLVEQIYKKPRKSKCRKVVD